MFGEGLNQIEISRGVQFQRRQINTVPKSAACKNTENEVSTYNTFMNMNKLIHQLF